MHCTRRPSYYSLLIRDLNKLQSGFIDSLMKNHSECKSTFTQSTELRMGLLGDAIHPRAEQSERWMINGAGLLAPRCTCIRSAFMLHADKRRLCANG